MSSSIREQLRQASITILSLLAEETPPMERRSNLIRNNQLLQDRRWTEAYTTLMAKLTGQERPLEDERYVIFCTKIILDQVVPPLLA
uniref:Uncharacterized protein n=1 Tax=Ditylenchus dipsaci TaxID=166011 RepID=A0A915EEF9_9BILA